MWTGEHTQSIWGGFNKFVVQYATDARVGFQARQTNIKDVVGSFRCIFFGVIAGEGI
jgi:maltoporin